MKITLLLVSFGFSFVGAVVFYVDQNGGDSVTWDGTIVRRIRQSARIQHGWPMVFLERDAFFKDNETLPRHFAHTPPLLIPALWNPFRGTNAYSFKAPILALDVLFIVLINCCVFWICGAANRFWVSRKLSTREIMIFIAITSGVFALLAGYWTRHVRWKAFEARCKSVGALTAQPFPDLTMVRIFGFENVPESFTYCSRLHARDVSKENFDELLSIGSSKIRNITLPWGQAIDERLARKLMNNFSLEELFGSYPDFTGSDYSCFNSLRRISFLDVSREQIGILQSQIDFPIEFSHR